MDTGGAGGWAIHKLPLTADDQTDSFVSASVTGQPAPTIFCGLISASMSGSLAVCPFSAHLNPYGWRSAWACRPPVNYGLTLRAEQGCQSSGRVDRCRFFGRLFVKCHFISVKIAT